MIFNYVAQIRTERFQIPLRATENNCVKLCTFIFFNDNCIEC